MVGLVEREVLVQDRAFEAGGEHRTVGVAVPRRAQSADSNPHSFARRTAASRSATPSFT
jgi:hypothetical protein